MSRMDRTHDLRDAYRFLPPVVREALVSFARAAGIAREPPDRIFEHFATYHVLRHAGLDEFDVETAIVAGENDTQLDTVAITINGSLVSTPEEVEQLAADALEGEPFDVRFVFAQATMSTKFPSDKVALFTAGVLNFFLPQTHLKQSVSLVRWRELKDRVLKAAMDLGKGPPVADVYVVWPGTWTSMGHGEHATGVAGAALATREATGIVGAAHFHRIDSPLLQTLIVDDLVSNEGEIELQGLIEVSRADGVSFACIGLVKAVDYLRCLVDGDPSRPDARLREGVFHGNVRAFLGAEERVNRHIRLSLIGDRAAQAEFALRNNGVTIIAVAVEPGSVSGRLKLRNFQVVNGCQTSNVLFLNRAHLTPDAMLPIKIVATEDAEVAQNIILGLNRQTQIDELQILSRHNFVRRLKRHFDVASAQRPLWIDDMRTPLILFERRAGEFRHIKAPSHRERVVTMQELMQAYAAAFLEAPHSVHEGGKGYLIRQVPRRMFAADHDVGFYFCAALLLWRARRTLGKPEAWASYPAKHQIVFAMRTLADPPGGLPLGRRDGEAHEYLKRLRTVLLDDAHAGALAAQAKSILEEAARRQATPSGPASPAIVEEGRPPPAPPRMTGAMAQREAFTDQVLALCLEARRALPPTG